MAAFIEHIQTALNSRRLKYRVQSTSTSKEAFFFMEDDGINMPVSITTERVEGQEGMYYCLMHVFCPDKVDTTRRDAVAEVLARLNMLYRMGNFEMDMDDGDVLFKISFPYSEQSTSTIVPTLKVLLEISFTTAARGFRAVDLVKDELVTPERAISASETPQSAVAARLAALPPEARAQLLQAMQQQGSS